MLAAATEANRIGPEGKGERGRETAQRRRHTGLSQKALRPGSLEGSSAAPNRTPVGCPRSDFMFRVGCPLLLPLNVMIRGVPSQKVGRKGSKRWKGF